jgi:hypothetical protein
MKKQTNGNSEQKSVARYCSKRINIKTQHNGVAIQQQLNINHR